MNKQLKLAIEKFNSGEYFECHDILEDYWFECRQDEKDFYQGILHYAVAFHHLIDKNNPQGAMLQFKKCVKRLSSLGKTHEGIDVSKIVKSAHEYLKRIESGEVKLIRKPVI